MVSNTDVACLGRRTADGFLGLSNQRFSGVKYLSGNGIQTSK